ncbi:ArsR family transcriptional regulator [Streptomyces cinereospinus]|uniref:ArsR family transcriptional regulator n=1 Tax=Streptomyces cinereospinus TaxID=285561 RepID=A0ABV5N4Q7_9ACTN
MLRTPAHDTRLRILEWLKDPVAHFPHRRHTDLVADGVCAEAVAEKPGVHRSVARTHLTLLADLGMLRAERVRRRTYYRRDEARIAEVARLFEKGR